ncbi:MAG: DUF3179 domain-containing protein [Planctomycetes bacterium]|nr:DUF3179 domain-containing protein [Planctomycetota bacterium]
MSNDSQCGNDERYEWTAGRILLAGVFIAIATGSLTVFARKIFIEDVQFFTSRSVVATTQSSVRMATGIGFNLDNLQVPRNEILHGGPPKDGIRALNEPVNVPVLEAEFINGNHRVVGVVVNDQARAYPIGILSRHEAINDVLGDTPILIIYCPLCDSVSVTSRLLNNEVHEFGISGMLRNSNVLLFDRADDSLWSQLGFQAISGPNAGKSLTHLDNWELTTFEDWAERNPDSTVVSFDTGLERGNYNISPYGDYAQTDHLMFPVDVSDKRLNLKERIIAIKFGNTARAYPLTEIQRSVNGVVNDTIEGEIFILESSDQTNTVRIVQAPENALIAHTFWFAWAAYEPNTEIYKAP